MDNFSSNEDVEVIFVEHITNFPCPMSRSEAKRVWSKIKKDKVNIFDFRGISNIGPSFADEFFILQPNKYSDVLFFSVNLSAGIKQMKKRIMNTRY